MSELPPKPSKDAMDLNKLNQWLSLLANVGVLVGLVFLILEINQTNRIAIYTAESTRSSQFIGMNTSRIENPEIIARLMVPEPEPALSDTERVQALYTARQQVNTWIDAENAVINGLLSEATRRGIYSDIDVVIAEMPGLIPYFEYLLTSYGLDGNSGLETMDHLMQAIEAYRQKHADETSD
jgi:hypothetical protein